MRNQYRNSIERGKRIALSVLSDLDVSRVLNYHSLVINMAINVNHPLVEQAILSMEGHSNKWVKSTIITSLARLGDPIHAHLVSRYLGDEEEMIRVESCNAIGQIGNVDHAELLGNLVAKESEALGVRVAATQALGNLRATSQLPLLKQVMSSVPSIDLIGAIVNVFAKCEDRTCNDLALDVIFKSDSVSSYELDEAIPELADESMVYRLQYEIRSQGYRHRIRAAELLLACERKAASAVLLMQLRSEKDLYVRSRLVRAMGFYQDKRAANDIFQVAYTEDDELVTESINALFNLGDSRAAQVAVDLLESIDSCYIPGLIKVIKRWPDKRAVDPLMKLLSHEESRVRVAAIEGLAAIGGHKIWPAIARLCKDADVRVRPAVALALSQSADARYISTIEMLLNDPEYRIRPDVALIAMAKLRGTASYWDFTSKFRANEWAIQLNTFRILASIAGTNAVKAMSYYLHDHRDPAVEHDTLDVAPDYAAQVLGELGDTSAIAPLLEAMEAGRGVCACARALVAIGDDGVVDRLLDVLRLTNDSHEKEAIACAIYELGEDEDIHELFNRLPTLLP